MNKNTNIVIKSPKGFKPFFPKIYNSMTKNQKLRVNPKKRERRKKVVSRRFTKVNLEKI